MVHNCTKRAFRNVKRESPGSLFCCIRILRGRNSSQHNLRKSAIFEGEKNEGYENLFLWPRILVGTFRRSQKNEGVCVAMLASQDDSPTKHHIIVD